MNHKLKNYLSNYFKIKNKTKIFIFLYLFIISSTAFYDSLMAFDFFGKKERLKIIEKFGGDFKLTGPDRGEISSLNFRGKILLINFGYTYCPDVCPMTLSHLKQVMLELGDLSENVQVFFISIDPERDTPSKLKDYVPYFDSTFIGLTGSVKEIKPLPAKDSDVASGLYGALFKPKIGEQIMKQTDAIAPLPETKKIDTSFITPATVDFNQFLEAKDYQKKNQIK